MAIAFFDVDETLIAMKSMFAFLRVFLARVEDPTHASYQRIMATIDRRIAMGATREDINRYYYSLYCGHRQSEVRRHAQAFFDAMAVPYQMDVVRRLKAHQAAGDEVVAVSGAMRDIIYPVMDRLGIDAYLCSEPEVVDDHYTGRLLAQAIGAGKARLVRAHCAQRGVDPGRCSAYGDHVSDADMLGAVGRGVAVYPQEALRALARARHWEVMLKAA